MAKYEAIDIAALQSEYARISAEPGANTSSDYLDKFVRLPEREGFTLMRILPRVSGGVLYCATRVHTLINPTTGRKSTFHCHRNLVPSSGGKAPKWQGDCIICKYYSDLWAKSESLNGKAKDDMQNQARAIKPVERYYYNVIVRSEKDKEGIMQNNVGPKIYSCGKTVHEKILRAILGDDVAGEKPLGDITHPVTGRDFRVVKKVVKSGKDEYPNYDNSKFDDASPAGTPEEFESWMDNLNDLKALRSLKTPDELKHALRVHCGMIKEGEANQEDDELNEFRAAANRSTVSAPVEKVREDLAVTTTTESKPASSSDDEGILADDEFMKELESM